MKERRGSRGGTDGEGGGGRDGREGEKGGRELVGRKSHCYWLSCGFFP